MSVDDTGLQTHYDRMFQMIMAAWGSQVVRTLALLSVAEHLESAELTAAEIAERESADPAMTYRVLRAAVALGVLRYDAGTQRFAGTPLLRVLHGDADCTLKHYAQASPSAVFWGPALRLPETVARGRNHVAETLGCEVFEYFGRHPDEARLFSAAMSDLSTPVVDGTAAAVDLGDARFAVDVGGANGALLCELVRRHPQLSGAVLDLPHVTPGAAEEAERRGLADRVTAVAGDFFAAVPAADLYLLKHILHDWDDDACVRILSTIKSAMHPGARIVIVEMLLTADAPSPSAALTDMAMLFATTGRERERHEYEALLAAAGFRVTAVTPIHHPYAVIEAAAA